MVLLLLKRIKMQFLFIFFNGYRVYWSGVGLFLTMNNNVTTVSYFDVSAQTLYTVHNFEKSLFQI